MKKTFGFVFCFTLLLFLLNNGSPGGNEPERYEFTSVHMGTQFQIILYACDETVADDAARSAFEEVEELNKIFSDYEETSELNRLSRESGSGVWIGISDHLFNLLELSKQVSDETDGLFDITIGPFSHLWRELNRMPNPELPGEQELSDLSERVGYQHIELNRETRSARLLKHGMQLDAGGIAKGYAAEQALRILREQHQIQSALINAGGDITLGSPPPDKDHWNVAVPLQREDESYEILNLQLSGKSVSTSGNLFQFIEIDGETYSHIIDPQTGLGVTEFIQATVITSDGTLADAYASALTIMNPEQGLRFANNLDRVEAYIERKNENGIEVWISDGFEEYFE